MLDEKLAVQPLAAQEDLEPYETPLAEGVLYPARMDCSCVCSGNSGAGAGSGRKELDDKKKK